MKPWMLIIGGLILAGVSAFVGLGYAMLPGPTDAERAIVQFCLLMIGAGIVTMLIGIVMAIHRRMRRSKQGNAT